MKAQKFLVLTVFAAFILSSCTTSRHITNHDKPYSSHEMEMAKKFYSTSLDHEIDSIVESAMMCIGKLKLKYPEADFSDLVDDLNEKAAKGKTPCIRYKALITLLVLEKPDLINGGYEIVRGFDDNQFYSFLSDNINKDFLQTR